MNQKYQINIDWKRIADRVVNPNQRVLVLGASDTGKSTFCRYLVDYACDASLKVALVDADVGQSQIGPPTTIGMRLYESPELTDTSLSENTNEERESGQIADSLYFVGSITPQRNLLPILTGTRLMTDSAVNKDADFIVIDTTGYVHDGAAAMLKQQKIELLCPNHIVCIGRSKDMDRIVGCFSSLNSLTIHHLLPHRLTRTKSREARKRNRKARFKAYFADSELQKIPIEKIRGARTPFFNGRIANDKELDILSGLTETEVVYAEWGHRSISLISQRKLTHDTIKKLKDYLSLLYVTAERLTHFDNRLVGMLDNAGDNVTIGIIEAIDYQNRELHIRCKSGIASEIRLIQLGEYRF